MAQKLINMKVLAPVDFSDISKYGTTLAVKVARELNAELHFLNVIPLPSHILLTPEGELFEDGDFDISEQQLKKTENVLKMKAWVEEFCSDASSRVCFGQVNDQILDYSNKINADLIVMGTHATFGLQNLLNKSHAEYVAMHAKMPMLSVKCDRSDTQIKSVVLANSFNNTEIENSEITIAIQRAFEAKLYLLRICNPNEVQENSQFENNMREFASKNKLENVEFATFIDADIEDGIMRFVAEKDIDIISIGSHQRTGLNKIINGCVSADVLNHAMKPILIHPLK
jgi:nucleotide-binding universal stress UspA family protein